jgi:tripartite-type tricarboxylate transporter receptor subunit TctC
MFKQLSKMPAALGITALAAVAIFGTTSADAQYYKGKTITVLVGAGPSSGATIMARIMSKNLAANIEGSPNVIVKNLPGGGGSKAQNFLYEKAKKDGMTVYYGFWNGLAQVVGAPGLRFKYENFTPVGGLKLAGVLVWGRKDALPKGSTDPADIGKGKKFRIGTIGIQNGRSLMALLGLEALKANYTFIGGYRGNGKVRLAVASGELMGSVDAIHIYLPIVNKVMKGLNMGMYHVPLIDQAGNVSSNPILTKYAPNIVDVYKKMHGVAPSGLKWEAFKQSVVLTQSMQHMVMGPPGMNEEAAKALEVALKKAMASKDFAKDMKNQVIFVPKYVDRATAKKVLAGPSKTSPELKQYYKDFIAKHSQ